jgi:adenosylcobinamide amidohydrolase
MRPFRLSARPRWLIAEFDQPAAILSWAIVNGGWQKTSQVAWLYLKPNEIAGIDDPREWMRSQLHAEQLSSAVGLMTSRREHAWVEAFASEGEICCWAVATVGMSNALRAGDPSGTSRASTINLFLCSSQPLTMEASLEWMALASEAKSLAVRESGLLSIQSKSPATGTGTDCIAIAWPADASLERTPYAGKHTAIGAAGGRATLEAVRQGIAVWREEYPQG